MQEVVAKINVFTGTTEKLMSMDVSDTNALQVEVSDVESVRTTISRIHGKTSMVYKTKKNNIGILVWRVA